MLKFETDIPTPVSKSGRSPIYPFGEMPIVASFAISERDKTKLVSAAKKWRERHPGWTYRTKTKEGQIRLWRLS